MQLHLVSILLIFISGYAFSEESIKTSVEELTLSPDDEPFYNVLFGVSPFDGMLGIEVQKGSHSIGFGFPGQVSYRYYSQPYSNSPFYGLYAGLFKEQGDGGKKFEGEVYENAEGFNAGAGAGYRWQWSSGWNITACLSIFYMDKEYSSSGEPEKHDTLVTLFPGVNVGFKF